METRTILIVDDQLDSPQALRLFLEDAGFRVILTQNGETIFNQMAESELPDLVLLDMGISEIDAFKTFRYLKTFDQARDIPVIFMIASPDSIDKIYGIESSEVDYIIKPVDFREILARITTHLSLRSLKEQLQQSEARYRAVVEEQTELICRYLPDGTLTFVNPAYCRAWGKPPEELLGISLLSLSRRDIDLDIIQGLLHEKTITTFEAEVPLRDGTYQRQQWIALPILNSQGDIGEFQGVGRDITRLKQVERELQPHQGHLEDLVAQRTAELKISEQQYRLLAEQVTDGIGVIQDHHLVFCNQAWRNIFGFSAEYLFQIPFVELFQQQYSSVVQTNLDNLYQGESVPPWQIRHITADEREIWVEGRSTLISWEGQAAILTTVRDITNIKRQELSLKQERNYLRQENIALKANMKERYRFAEIIGKSEAMQQVYELIAKAAAFEATPLI